MRFTMSIVPTLLAFCLVAPTNAALKVSGGLVMRASSGFKLESETVMTNKLMAAAAAKVGKSGTLLSTSAALALERSSSNQMLRQRLSSARFHLNTVVLKIQQYTDAVEMGVRSNPGWTPTDADELSKKLEKPIKKARTCLLSLGDDLKSDKFATKKLSDGLQWVISQGDPAFKAAGDTEQAMRNNNGKDAVAHLSHIRDTIDGIDAVLQSGFKEDS